MNQRDAANNSKVRSREGHSNHDERDATLGMPKLIIPSIQVNVRAGDAPPPEDNGVSYLKVPLNQL